MKQRKLIIAALVCAAILGAVAWWFLPTRIAVPEAVDIQEVSIFDGNTGETFHITSEDEISQIMDALRTVKLKKDKPSVGLMGYRFRLTIYLKSGKEAGGWDDFIINSENTIRKDPFFYKAVDGTTGYEYICRLIGK